MKLLTVQYYPYNGKKDGEDIMTMSIIALTPREEFLQQIDPDLCEIKETITKDGLRTIAFEYKFQDPVEDKQLFKLGNKLWITGDINLKDCLYVINTKVKQDYFKDNCFTFEAEEVLVELNNAPVVSHLDLDSAVFKTRNVNNNTTELEVKIDWNSLNYWFGDFFNLGVVQDCLNASVQWIPFFGSYNLMNLLRFIEEQTGNVFVTRYEKDIQHNTIHRYLDFLNPINVSKHWEFHLEYDFAQAMVRTFYDENGNETTDDKPWEVLRYNNSHVPTGQTEDVEPYDPEEEAAILQYDTLDTDYKWIQEDEEVEDEALKREYHTIPNFDTDNAVFQITTRDGDPLNADGTIYTEGDDNPLIWSCADIDIDGSNPHVLITLFTDNENQIDILGLTANNKSFAVVSEEGAERPGYVAYTNSIHENADDDNKRENGIIPDDSYFEIYDQVTETVLFRTQINRSIGTVHEEVLDFGFNLDNIEYDIDESNVYTSVAPILQYNAKNTSNTLTRDQFSNLLRRYRNLSFNKGDKIPMILQKITVKASSLENAKMALGNYVEHSGANESTNPANYWVRPYKPQDNRDTTTPANSTWEFIRATAYWRAPYRKVAGHLEVELTDLQSIEYDNIFGRPDTRDEKGVRVFSKTGTTESTDEDVYSIYNQVALYLKDHSTPKIEFDVDIANLEAGKYNDYDIHDKVYVKIPGSSELITARVIETRKEANDIAANTIKISNYSTTTLKNITYSTVIHCNNVNYKYPNSKQVTARLENLDYDETDSYSVKYPANKLISFTLYAVKDGQRTFKKVYTKKTDAWGYAKLNTKFDPGDYEFEVSFAGDEEYTETDATCKISVGGKKPTKKKQKASNKNKTTNNNKKKVTKTTYYDKLGRSPDKKKILAIGRPSASGDEGKYDFYGMEFQNYCPKCGKKGTLFWDIFFAGNEHSNKGYVRVTGNKEGGSAEGHIFCANRKCDGDFSCQGREHGYTNKKLKVTKKRFKSTKSDAYKLKKGKYVYSQATKEIKTKNNKNTKKRKVIGPVSKKIQNLALSIVKDKTGYQAMREICNWMDKNIPYRGYTNFVRGPQEVVKRGGNCCDQTRLLFHLFDAAGLTEFYDMYYVNLSCPSYGHVYARIRSKKTKKWTNIDPASDSYGCYGYVCDSCSRTSPVDSKYPKLPFG